MNVTNEAEFTTKMLKFFLGDRLPAPAAQGVFKERAAIGLRNRAPLRMPRITPYFNENRM